jgi:Antibiotic biosynthesis monooxygenase
LILRIARFSVAADEEETVVRALREQAGSAERPTGLEDLVFAIRRGRDSVEFVMVGLWTDIAAIRRALGPAWNAPGGVANIADRIADQRVEHFDVFADDWPELVAFLDMSLDERRDAEMSPGDENAADAAEEAARDATPVPAIV